MDLRDTREALFKNLLFRVRSILPLNGDTII